MPKEKDNPFAFLGQAKPGSLFRLLDKLPRRDQAMVLAHLPPWLTAQVMAYFPDNEQGVLMAAMREARRASPEEADATVGKLRELINAARDALPSNPVRPAGAGGDDQGGAPRPAPGRPTAGQTIASVYGKTALPPNAKPQPWKPRHTSETPINAAPKPNRPPPVKGDPAKSPLKANILELLGLGKREDAPETPRQPDGTAAAARPPESARTAPPPEKAKDGLVPRPNLSVSKTPRMLGTGKPKPKPPAAAPSRPPTPGSSAPAASGRKMDGMAILAAILRNASLDVRQNVASDNPSLFKALKDRMFVFDDLSGSDDDALAQVFTVAPVSDAALALRFAAPVLRDRALRAVSPRRAAMLRDAATGAKAGLDAIEEAQARVLDVALRLQSAGRIIIDPDDPDLAL